MSSVSRKANREVSSSQKTQFRIEDNFSGTRCLEEISFSTRKRRPKRYSWQTGKIWQQKTFIGAPTEHTHTGAHAPRPKHTHTHTHTTERERERERERNYTHPEIGEHSQKGERALAGEMNLW